MYMPRLMDTWTWFQSGINTDGGYREHDILVITEDGNRNIKGFPYGPEHNIIWK